ncbi:TPA: hypothetical protein ACVU5P_004214 [Vibrio parahaemolyticus]
MLSKTLLRTAATCDIPYHLHLKTDNHDVLMDFALNRIEHNENHMIIFVCSKEDKAKFFEALMTSGFAFNYPDRNSIYIGDIEERKASWTRPNIIFIDYNGESYVEKLAGYGSPHQSEMRETFIADSALLDKPALMVMKAGQSGGTLAIITYGAESSHVKDLVAITDEAGDLEKLRDNTDKTIDVESYQEGLSLECVYLDHFFSIEREEKGDQWYMRVKDEESCFFGTVCDGWMDNTEHLDLPAAFLHAAELAEMDPMPTLEGVKQAISKFINKTGID